MLALLQRVKWAEVEVEGRIVSRIGPGLLVYIAVGRQDSPGDAEQLAEKVANLRIFGDENGKLNLSVRDARGGVLAISNFTLAGDAGKGRRPTFTAAASAAEAEPIYQAFLAALARSSCQVAGGVFGANMLIRSAADGPVNILIQPRQGGKGGGSSP